ncbi:MAG: endonuclease [Tepidisphaeraceae bacterium]
MPRFPMRRSTCCLQAAIAFAVVSAVPALGFADAYDAPASYYTNATGTGSTLKTQLRTIITAGFVSREYGDARYYAAILDQDPNNPSNILLAYSRQSVKSDWDQAATWNREHVWPASLLGVSGISNSYNGPASDLFELRPAATSVNGARGNYPYGNIAGSLPSNYGTLSYGGKTYWYPGSADMGDVSRSVFYMATRYSNLSIVNGWTSATNTMGDLASLLKWHYQDEVDTFERRKNQYVYSSALNPTYYQGNRNPFIDHPEYVWTIFGSEANNSQLTVATSASAGASTKTVELGRVIAGQALGTQSVTLSKSGSTPTTFDVTVAGEATSTLSGPRHSFDYNTQSRSFTVGLSGGTATPGLKTGTITVNNTDLTSAAAGQGSGDGDDVVTVNATVLTHADPSFSLASSQRTLTLDFGIVAEGSSIPAMGFTVNDRPTTASATYTAKLDIDSVTLGGANASAFTTSLTPTLNIAGGAGVAGGASFVATALGTYAATLTMTTSDENIAGATALPSLVATLTGRVALGGDVNLDGVVNFSDLLMLASNYNAGATTWSGGDFNRDNATNFSDLLVMAANYGTQLGSSFASDWALAQSMVPEPTLVSAIGLAALTLKRKRR